MGAPLTRRVFLGSLAAASAAAEFWEKHSFPDWTTREVDEMLTDSPWAKSFTLRFELGAPPARQYSDIGLPRSIQWPGGGGGWPGGGNRIPAPGQGGGRNTGASVGAESYLTMRWSSALPIRQALLLDEHGSADRIPADALASLDEPQTNYVVEIFGLPAQVVHIGREEMEDALLSSAQITLHRRSPIRAVGVYAPPQGNYRSLTLRFPRTDPITLEADQAEVFAAAGPFDFRQKFSLEQMLYGGALEL